MPVYRLGPELIFPPPDHAEDGLLAVGGDLRPQRLVLAYSLGIFPWYSEGHPILWHSPDPRMMMWSDQVRVNKSLRQALRKRPYEIRLDTAFRQVVEACASVPRPGQDGTWITDDMIDAYCDLHDVGLAHSAEAWRDDELVGGLYGVSLGRAYFGESMFARASDASKIAFVKFLRQLTRWNIRLVDCQIYTEHLARFGAFECSRDEYLATLQTSLQHPTRQGHWTLDEDLRTGSLPAND